MKKFDEYITEGRINKSKSKPHRSFNDIKNQYDLHVRRISLYNTALYELNGIEKFKKLENLSCWLNQITSLEPLRNLINLRMLECNNNKITSLEPLENLINLYSLCCHHNELQSFKGLPENITYIFGHENPLNNWQEDVESFIRAYKLSDNKEWLDKQERFSEIIDLIKINMI